MPLNLLASSGAVLGDIAAFDGTDWKASVAPTGITTSLTSDFTITATPKTGVWEETSTISKVLGGHGNIIKLDTDRVIVMQRNSTWVVYDLSGGVWTQVGNAFNPGWGNVELQGAATLTPTRFVVGNSSTGLIYAFDFDGTNISQVGNTLSVSAPNNNITELNSTDFAVLVGSSLRTYRFDGTNFSLIGNAFTATSMNYIEHIGGARVAAVDTSAKLFKVFEFDGTDWAQIGNSFTQTLAISGPTSICAMDKTNNAHTFACVNSPDSVNTNVVYLTFDGTNGTEAGVDGVFGDSSGDTRGCGLSEDTVLFGSSSKDVRGVTTDILQFDTKFADDNLNGVLGPLFYVGSTFTLSGTVIDGDYTVAQAVDADSVLVVENITPQSVSGKMTLQLVDGDTIIANGGQYLVKSGGPVLERVETQTIEAGASVVDFVKGFDGDYIHIFEYEDIRTTAGANRLLEVRLSSDGGVTFDDGVSDYNYQSILVSTTGTISGNYGEGADSMNLSRGGGDDHFQGYFAMRGMNKVGWSTLEGHVRYGQDGGITTGIGFAVNSANHRTEEVHNAVRMVLSTGTFESGKVTHYRKAI